ncbi:MAG: DegT/DnrJ/EryC1/StrS family aminotransferase [Candidatus Sumerlaeota bacterium]|nr:DegT/DnrJ/EryC1/StrS family aminotransferase [Candidatus Sumerlaeota bacterium]
MNASSGAARRVPYVDLAGQHAPIKDEILAAIEKVLLRGDFILGEEVATFERNFAEYCGAPHVVALRSGTDALTLALRALGVGAGDEAITAPNSFVASAAAIALAGARPVFADVRDDYNIDPDAVEKAITPHTKAVVAVHLTGRPADMDALVDLCRRKGLHLIEDAAQAAGAEYRGRKVGSFGVGCFSFHPLKTLSACGDGGALATSDPRLAERVRVLRNLGLRDRDHCVEFAAHSRLDTVQAALLNVKLKYLDTWNDIRRGHAQLYTRLLHGIVDYAPADKPHEKAVYHTYVIRAKRRDSLRGALADRGVDAKVHYPIPIHLQEAAKDLGCKPGDFPQTERQAKEILSLPVHQGLAREDIEYVAAAIWEALS